MATSENSESIVLESSRSAETPTLRFIHYNDVYHLEPGSRDPVGGIARFQTVCDYYRDDKTFEGQPALITLFSGDAFNPSIESSVTKGAHMVPFLNRVGTDVSCLGNHDLDFGVPQFEHLAKQCTFPWLLANVLDPALGNDVPLGNCQKTLMITASNGVKVGIIGIVEREWLETINSLPPDLQYKSATATVKELVPQLRAQGAEMIIALTHAREPNDVKLANNTGGELVDLIVGGHDHFYAHSVVNGVHLLRSGTDFRQLSYLKAWKKQGGSKGWDFEITRRDIMRDIAEDKETLALVKKLTSGLAAKMEKPLGYTSAPLDARFTTVRLRESNIGNFVCDLMRFYYQGDCTLMASGTIRGDQVYPPGVLRIKDIMSCFPFEDPVIVIKVKGQALLDALENSVSTYPALEGRFPQVSNITFSFDPNEEPNHRVSEVEVAGKSLDLQKDYKLVTRAYMAHGKDGFQSLLMESEGGVAEELVSEENGMLISAIIRQYFMSLKILGRWKRWCNTGMAPHWSNIHDDLHEIHPVRVSARPSPAFHPTEPPPNVAVAQFSKIDWDGSGLHASSSSHQPLSHVETSIQENDDEDDDADEDHDSKYLTPSLKSGSNSHNNNRRRKTIVAGHVIDSDSEDEHSCTHTDTNSKSLPSHVSQQDIVRARELMIMRKVTRKWWRLAGIKGHPDATAEEEGEFVVGWTKGIAPRVEGRIRMVGAEVAVAA